MSAAKIQETNDILAGVFGGLVVSVLIYLGYLYRKYGFRKQEIETKDVGKIGLVQASNNNNGNFINVKVSQINERDNIVDDKISKCEEPKAYFDRDDDDGTSIFIINNFFYLSSQKQHYVRITTVIISTSNTDQIHPYVHTKKKKL